MTLNAKIKFFMDFVADFGLRDTFQERMTQKPTKINME